MAKRKRRAHGEGGLVRRKDGRWAGSFYSLEGKRVYVYGNTQQEALEKLRKAQSEQEQGILATGPKLKLGIYLEQWLEEVKKPELRVSSYVKYKKLITRYIIPVLGNLQLQKMTPQHVQSFYTKMLKEGLSAKTVHSIHGVLHNALENAVRWHLVPTNVTDVVTPPRLEKHEVQSLTLDQARALLAAARGHRLDMLLTLALTTGMRRGELLALRWSDIDLESDLLHVRRTVDFIARYGYVEGEPKTARGRRKIVLPAFVVDLLKQHKQNQLEQRLKVGDAWQDRDLVICGLEGNYLNPRYLLKLFDKLLAEAGLSHMRFHDLRHSVVTLLLGMGVDPRTIQELVGHEDITTTLRIYSHVLPSMQQGVADKLGELFDQGL